MSNRLYIYDSLSEKLRVADAPFMTIGRGRGNVFRCSRMRVENGGSFAMRGGVCRFFPHSSAGSYSLNGQRMQRETDVPVGVLNLLVLGGGCVIVWLGEERQMPDFSAFESADIRDVARFVLEESGSLPKTSQPEVYTDTQGVEHPVPTGGMVHLTRVIDSILWVLHCKEPELLRMGGIA